MVETPVLMVMRLELEPTFDGRGKVFLTVWTVYRLCLAFLRHETPVSLIMLVNC